MQLQGALAPLCGTNVLVWDYGDHLYPLHYRHRPRPWAGVPGHPHYDQNEGSLFRQGLVATQVLRSQCHHDRYHRIECMFFPFLHLVHRYGPVE